MLSVDILVPVFNAECFLPHTLESIQAQTFQNWRVIVLDDCSTDKSYDIAQAFAFEDHRISVFRNEENLGMMRNWNKGISLCKADLYAKLDADDIWHPDMLQESLDALKKYSSAVMVCANYVNIDSEGQVLEKTKSQMPSFAQNKIFSCIPLVRAGSAEMLRYDVLRQGVSLIKRKIFDEIGMYHLLESEDTQASVDTEMYFRIGCHYQIYGLDKLLYYYRVHEESISYIDKNEGLQAKKMYEVKNSIMRYYFQHNKISAIVYKQGNSDTSFAYNLYLSSSYRKEKRYFRFLRTVAHTFVRHPFKTIRFYQKRITDL